MANTTLSSIDKSSGITLSNGNLTATGAANANHAVRGIDGQQDGAFYWEVNIGAQWGTSKVGVAALGAVLTTLDGDWLDAWLWQSSGSQKLDGSNSGTIATYTTSNNLQFALKMNPGAGTYLIWARVNGGNWNNDPTADPATGVNGKDISSIARAGLYPVADIVTTGDVCTFNFGDTAFTGTVPSGFTAGWPQNTTTIYADGGAAIGSAGSSTLNLTFNTHGANRVLLLLINVDASSGAPKTVSSVTTSGLTWAKRNSQVYQTSGNQELWYAYASAQQTAATAAITLSGTPDQVTAVLVPFVNSPATSFFDANGALPASANGNSASPSVNVTTNGGGFLLGMYGAASASNPINGGIPAKHGTGNGSIKGIRDGGGAFFNFASFIGCYVTGAVSAKAIPTQGTNSDPWGMMGDALALTNPEAASSDAAASSNKILAEAASSDAALSSDRVLAEMISSDLLAQGAASSDAARERASSDALLSERVSSDALLHGEISSDKAIHDAASSSDKPAHDAASSDAAASSNEILREQISSDVLLHEEISSDKAIHDAASSSDKPGGDALSSDEAASSDKHAQDALSSNEAASSELLHGFNDPAPVQCVVTIGS